jgi:hypothetical protein
MLTCRLVFSAKLSLNKLIKDITLRDWTPLGIGIAIVGILTAIIALFGFQSLPFIIAGFVLVCVGVLIVIKG